MQNVRLKIQGMNCQSCAMKIEKKIQALPYVYEASVNFANNSAVIDFNEQKTNPEELILFINDFGYKATNNPEQNQENSKISPRILAIFILSIPFLLEMVAMFFKHHLLPNWLQFLLATAVLTLIFPLYKSTWQALKQGFLNMDVLLIVGTNIIYFYSIYSWLSKQNQVYFESTVLILAGVSLGKYWEERVKRERLEALALLRELTLPVVHKVLPNRQTKDVPISSVQVGDILQVRTGERISADGIVIDGQALADESYLTGEALPVQKIENSSVLAGSFISNGKINFKVEKLGDKTVLGGVIKALEIAQNSKNSFTRYADLVSSHFVPIVLLIASATFLLTWVFIDLQSAFLRAVSVLLVACPCALGLATPSSVIIAMGAAIKKGIQFRDAETIEKSALVDTLVLDKTGTLTQGKAEVVGIYLYPEAQAKGLSEFTVLQIAASIADGVNHPLSEALVNSAKNKNIPLKAVNNAIYEPGSGIAAYYENKAVFLGSNSYTSMTLPKELPFKWRNYSLVSLKFDGNNAAIFAIHDELRPDAKAMIEALRANNIELHICSGDRKSVVDELALELGISDYQAECSPQDKAHYVESLQARGKFVAMFGDGINDTLALNIADVGFSLRGASDVALHSASVELSNTNLENIKNTFFIAKKCARNIKQNLFFAFFYNVLMIPLAIFGLINPVFAAWAMALSSLSVLFNSLRLRQQLQ